MLEELTKTFSIRPLKPLVYLMNKPIGFSSYTIVDLFKTATQDKAGHAGTLDPLAHGDLLILIGTATKLANLYLTSEKFYRTKILLGATTASTDLETELKISEGVLQLAETTFLEKAKEALDHLKSIQEFDVTKYSALKKYGKPLYKQKNENVVKTKRMQLINYKVKDIQSLSTNELITLLQNTQQKISNSLNLYKNITHKLNIIPREKQLQLFNNLLSIFDIHIKRLKDLEVPYTFTILDIDMHVSSGTYVRTLVKYLGDLLEIPTTTIDILRHNSYN